MTMEEILSFGVGLLWIAVSWAGSNWQAIIAVGLALAVLRDLSTISEQIAGIRDELRKLNAK